MRCPNQQCQRSLRIPANFNGKLVQCNFCDHIFWLSDTGEPVLVAGTPVPAPPLPGNEDRHERQSDSSGLGLELNDEQRVAVEHNGGDVLVLAGAGTGKTRTIIARAAYLIRTGVEPNRILAMTFTRRAARELTERLEKIVGSASAGVVAGTFHHFCLFTMRRMPKRFGIEGASVIDRDDQTQLMKLARGPFVVPEEQFPRASELVEVYSYARNTNRPVREYLTKHTDYDAATIEKMCQVFDAYDARKRKNAYLDYDDILFRFAKVLHETQEVRHALIRLYDHILVDEMQDTNPLQWLILDGLRDPAKLFCVGDDAQSIYAFRGADFQNVYSFTQRVPRSVVLKLQQNYRSTQEILDVANWLLRQSPLKYEKELRAHRGKGLKPRHIEFDSDLDEAKWIADDLIRRHEEGAGWRDHMILTRTAWGSRPMEAALIEKRIPYVFIGGMSLLQAAHVKDLLALIRSAASQRDELAWARYLTLWPKIGDKTAERLIAGIAVLSRIEDALIHLRSALPKRLEIARGPEIVRKYWGEPPRAIAEAGKFLSPLLENYYDNWEARRKDFDLLVRIAERHKSLLEFLETYTLDPISTTMASRLDVEDKVTLITVHSAKGTEARVCYLIRVEPGQYPHVRSLGDREEEEEDRRVLYVAMTRAQDELIITRSNSYASMPVFWGGSTAEHSDRGTAYFLQDLPDSLVEKQVVGYSPPNYGVSEVITPTPWKSW